LAKTYGDWQIEAIDKMFDSFNLTVLASNSKMDTKLKMSEFFEMVDFSNRYTYNGSVTYPPCESNVQWHVVKQIFPVKAAFARQYRKTLGGLF